MDLKQLYVHIPLILATFLIPLIVTVGSIVIRSLLAGPWPAGVDILIAKGAMDLSIAALLDPWKPIVSPLFKPFAQGLYISYGVLAIVFFAGLLWVERRSLQDWIDVNVSHIRTTVGRRLSTFTLLFISWFVVITFLAANIATVIVR